MRKIFDRLKYKFDNMMSRGTTSMIPMLFLVTMVAVVIVAIFAYYFANQDGVTFGALVWSSLMKTLASSNINSDVGTPLYIALMLVSTVVGIFVTSILIGLISTSFQVKLDSLQRGKSKVIVSNHTLILGWGDNIITVIKELIEANANQKKPVIVILGEIEMPDMYEELKNRIPSFKNTRIICRSGDTTEVNDLQMCSIEKAKSIIITKEDDSETVKTLLAIQSTDFDETSGHISAIFKDRNNLDVAKIVSKEQLEPFYLGDTISKIIAQTSLQPGLSTIYTEFLDFSGDEIYFYNDESIVGKKFVETLHMFNTSCVLGIVKGNQIYLNPLDNPIIEEEDKLIVLSEDDDTMVITNGSKVIEENISIEKAVRERNIINVLMIGDNHKSAIIIKEFDKYLKEKSHVKLLVNSEEQKKRVTGMSNLKYINFDVEIGDTTSRSNLQKLMNENFDRVIILSNETTLPSKRDSETLMTLLHLRDIAEKSNKDVSIVSEITNVKNASIVERAKVDDFIVSSDIGSLMLAQLSENRYLNNIYMDLFDNKGSKIFMKPASDYVLLDKEINFYTVVESAVQKNEIAIGYKIKSLSESKDNNYGIVLNPNKSDNFTFTEEDRVIVITYD